MAIVKQLDKRSGITYVYESVSYWDREKKQPRSKRTLIGRLDPATGEIVPTDGRGKRRAQKETDPVVRKGPVPVMKTLTLHRTALDLEVTPSAEPNMLIYEICHPPYLVV